MKIVHLSYYFGVDKTGGAAIAATRLHLSLIEAGLDSVFICVHNRAESRNDVVEFPAKGSFRRFFYNCLTRLARNLPRLTSYRDSCSVNCVSSGVWKIVNDLHPDLVHVHWISADAFSFEELKRITSPMIIHLHDLQMLCATEPYPHDDDRYVDGFTASNSSIFERWMANRKRSLIVNKCAAFIGPSKWAKRCADMSSVGRGHRSFAVPYFQDPVFRLYPSRRTQSNKFRILFGAFGGRRNPVKGFGDLAMAISLLPKEVREESELLVFGESGEPSMINGMDLRFAGTASDSETMIRIYHSADVFAFPSHEETWGQTKSEAMLCGLPVIAFDRTACAEGISHGADGWIAENGSMEDFAAGIVRFFELWKNGTLASFHAQVAKSATDKFSNALVLKLLMNAYDAVLKGMCDD